MREYQNSMKHDPGQQNYTFHEGLIDLIRLLIEPISSPKITPMKK